MNDIFVSGFNSMLNALVKILIVTLIGGIAVRRKILKQEHINALSEVTVNFLLPSLVISSILGSFEPQKMEQWWLLPLVGALMPLLLLLFTMLLYAGNVRKNLFKLPVATMQNAGYLVLPIVKLLYPQKFEVFSLYIFLLVLGFTPVLWTIGKLLVTQTKEFKFSVKQLITPPAVANLIGIALVFLGLNKIPSIVIEPIELLGSATVPVAMFILGATLGSVSIHKLPKFIDTLKLTFVKFIVSPAIMIFVLIKTGFYVQNPLMAELLVLEAAAAPAANLIVMVRKYGGNVDFVGAMMLEMYFASLFFMPLTLAVWRYVIN